MSPEDDFNEVWRRIGVALYRRLGRTAPALIACVGLFALYPEEMIRAAAGVMLMLIMAREWR